MYLFDLFIQFDSGNDNPYRFYRGVYRSDAFSYCVFASEAIIRMIDANIEVQRRNYLLDATFKVCPLGEFNQFLIIHIEYMQAVSDNEITIFFFDFINLHPFHVFIFVSIQTIPFIFALMSRKTEACYQHLFEYINANVFQ